MSPPAACAFLWVMLFGGASLCLPSLLDPRLGRILPERAKHVQLTRLLSGGNLSCLPGTGWHAFWQSVTMLSSCVDTK